MPPAAAEGQKRKVLIFRNEWLPHSETFVLAQARSMETFTPVFAGVHKALHSMALPKRPILVGDSATMMDKVRRRVFWRTSIAPEFNRNVRSERPALVHAHFAVDGAAALPLARMLRVPLVVTLHGYDVTSSDLWLGRCEEGRVYLRRRSKLWEEAACFLCVSDFIYQKAIESGFPREKLHVHYTGTDLRVFDGAKVERDRGLIVFTGRLVEKKGCRYFLEALSKLKREKCPFHAVVLGTGPLEAEMRAQALQAGIACQFMGSQTPEEVRMYLARARLFCVPSVTASSGDGEGLGMVFAEAQAMGTPVVSFRHGGIPEVVLDGHTGLLAPEKNSDVLADHLSQLLTEEQLWQQMSERGISWIRERFNLQIQTSLLEQKYEEVLSRWS